MPCPRGGVPSAARASALRPEVTNNWRVRRSGARRPSAEYLRADDFPGEVRHRLHHPVETDLGGEGAAAPHQALEPSAQGRVAHGVQIMYRRADSNMAAAFSLTAPA